MHNQNNIIQFSTISGSVYVQQPEREHKVREKKTHHHVQMLTVININFQEGW